MEYATFLREMGNDIKKKCGAKKVFLLVSGGVDSTVAFTLLNKVLANPTCVASYRQRAHAARGVGAILTYMKAHGFHNCTSWMLRIDSCGAFKCDGPEQKRRIIAPFYSGAGTGAERLGLNPRNGSWARHHLPDTIESAGTKHAERIKTHHNRVPRDGILERGEIVEPLALLYKDEVRELGTALDFRITCVAASIPGPA